MAAETEASILLALEAGKGIGSTARELGVGVGTVHRIARKMKATAA